MTSESNPEHDRLRSAIKRLETECHAAVNTHATLLEANPSTRLVEALAHTPAGITFRTVHRALTERLVATLARLHDDLGIDRASLPTIFRLLEDKSCRKAVIDAAAGRERPPGKSLEGAEAAWKSLLERFGPDTSEAAETLRTDVMDARALEANTLDAVRDFRNQVLSHNLHGLEQEHRLFLKNVKGLYEATLDVGAKLLWACEGLQVDFASHERERREYAQQFWEFLIVGGLENRMSQNPPSD